MELLKALLTEVLPFELPVRINNEAFFNNIKEKKTKKLYNSFLNLKEKYTIPFNYYVRKYGGEGLRLLSLIHPSKQVDIAELYDDYSPIMVYFCNRSPLSLRHIVSISKDFNKSENTNSDDADDTVEMQNEDEKRYYKSFFTYEEVDLMAQFYNRFSFVKQEQKYKYLRYLDISKFFYNIYTHSLCWAIKGKDNSKTFSSKVSFENKFDKVMQQSNYNETAGIVVGPEISRIFAEIILQRIDRNIIDSLQQINLSLGKDYVIKRYVDDFLIFSNSIEKMDIIENAISKELSEYKFYINNSKTTTISRPFLTKETKARIETKKLFEQLIDKYWAKCEKELPDTIPKSDKVILDYYHYFSMIAQTNNVSYGVINRVALSIFKCVLSNEKDYPANCFSSTHYAVILELAFLVYNLDACTTASIKLSHVMYLIKKRVSNDLDSLAVLNDLAARLLKHTIDNYLLCRSEEETNIELQNVLIVAYDVWNYRIPEEKLREIFHFKNNNSQLNYFQICTLLYLIKDLVGYNNLKSDIVKLVKKKFQSTNRNIINSEATFLYLDLMTCPWIELSDKRNINDYYFKECTKTKKDKDDRFRFFSSMRRWFFDWDETHNIDEFLLKKEYYNNYISIR